MKKAIMLTLLGALSVTGFNVPASAGADVTRSASGVGRCFPETNPQFNLNTMYCQGTMAGIRAQQADPSRFANFSTDSTGLLYFGMVVNNTGYSCIAPSSMTEVWRVAMAANGWFSIAYDKTTGVCTAVSVAAGSATKTAL